jgi:hypothetical protein
LQHNLPGAIHTMRLKNGLRDVQTDRNGLLMDSPAARPSRSNCRCGGEPSTASGADIRQLLPPRLRTYMGVTWHTSFRTITSASVARR